MLSRLLSVLVISLSMIGTQGHCRADTVSGIEAAAFVIPQEIVPAQQGKHVSVLVALKVTNATTNAFLLNKFATPQVLLTSKDGTVLKSTNMGATTTFLPMRDFNRISTASDFIDLGPDDATYLTTEGSVAIFPDGHLYFRYQSRDGSVWRIGPLKSGTYQLTLRYTVGKNDTAEAVKPEQKLPLWEGSVLSKPIKFEIK